MTKCRFVGWELYTEIEIASWKLIQLAIFKSISNFDSISSPLLRMWFLDLLYALLLFHFLRLQSYFAKTHVDTNKGNCDKKELHERSSLYEDKTIFYYH